MSRKIDKSKKSNIKCEHCKYYTGVLGSMVIKEQGSFCDKKESQVNYWNRCKNFEWNERLQYVENKDY